MINNYLKTTLKSIYKLIVLIEVFLNFAVKNKKFIYKNPRLYYAGAFGGDIGGPHVKIQKLKSFFPEFKFRFNIVYLLSNSPNVNTSTINLIKKRSLPLILNQNGVFYPSWYGGDWKKQNLIMTEPYHAADYVLWQSHFCKIAADNFLGKRIGKGEILYNSVDTKIFLPKFNRKRDRLKLLITGNIRKKSNYRIQVVLESIKEIIKINKYIHLYIGGYIEDKNYFLEEIERLRIRDYVSFLGSYTQKEAPQIYQNVDVYVTLTHQDNCPSAVIEAMSCGLPVLYSSSGGTPELVGHNSGVGLKVPQDWDKIFVPSKKDIVEGILKIFEQKDSMSISSRERAVKFFDLEKWFKRHSEIFEISLN